MRRLAILLLPLSVLACQPIGQFTLNDASNAAAMAKAATFDPTAASRISCYQVFAILGGSQATYGGQPGVFTAVEATFELNAALQIPACQAIMAQALSHVAGKFVP